MLEFNNCKYALLGVESIEDAETVIKHFDEANKVKTSAKVYFYQKKNHFFLNFFHAIKL